MAIKGKKKSGSRGSQARRRPASAPRPVSTSRRREPWYNTAGGRVIAAVLVVLVISAIGAAIAVNRSNANKEEKRLEAIEGYSNEVTSISQAAAVPAGQMATIAAGSTPEQLESLKEDSEQWVTDLEAAGSRASALVPPEEVGAVNQFFSQSLQIYTASARLLGNAADAEGKLQQDLLTRASEIRAQATGIFTSAVARLDEILADHGGDPSGLQAPEIAGAAAAPPPPTEVPTGEEGQGQGGGGGQGQGGGGNNNGGGGNDGE